MTLEKYKKKVEDFLDKKYNNPTGTQKLMKEYEDDFQEYWEKNLSVEGMVMGMVMHLL